MLEYIKYPLLSPVQLSHSVKTNLHPVTVHKNNEKELLDLWLTYEIINYN